MRALGAQMLSRALIRRETADRDPEVDRLLAASHAEHVALARDFPQNEAYASNLGASWLERGDRARGGGDLATARACFQEARTIAADLAQRTPTAAKHQRSIGLAQDRLAAVARATGDADEALESAESAVMAHAEALRLHERAESHDELALARRVLLELYVERGAAREAAEAARAFAEDEPETFAREFDIAQGLVRAADLALRNGDTALAADARRETLGHLERALALDASRAERIVRAIEEWELTGEADFAALRARANGDG
jgi:tetratricopeptide (TPR) repeat protein